MKPLHEQILLLLQQKKSYSDIQVLLQCSPSTIIVVKKKYPNGITTTTTPTTTPTPIQIQKEVVVQPKIVAVVPKVEVVVEKKVPEIEVVVEKKVPKVVEVVAPKIVVEVVAEPRQRELFNKPGLSTKQRIAISKLDNAESEYIKYQQGIDILPLEFEQWSIDNKRSWFIKNRGWELDNYKSYFDSWTRPRLKDYIDDIPEEIKRTRLYFKE